MNLIEKKEEDDIKIIYPSIFVNKCVTMLRQGRDAQSSYGTEHIVQVQREAAIKKTTLR